MAIGATALPCTALLVVAVATADGVSNEGWFFCVAAVAVVGCALFAGCEVLGCALVVACALALVFAGGDDAGRGVDAGVDDGTALVTAGGNAEVAFGSASASARRGCIAPRRTASANPATATKNSRTIVAGRRVGKELLQHEACPPRAWSRYPWLPRR